MTGATCQLVGEPVRLAERESEPDCFVELLECLADLRVRTDERCRTLSELPARDDPRVDEAIGRIAEMQEQLATVAATVASVHQTLQHEHLI